MTIVAAVQMCSSHHVDENLAAAEKLISAAAKQGAKLIVLPEMFACIGLEPTDKLAIQEKFGTGKIQDFLAANAKRHKVWIVGGTIPLACRNKNKVRAASLLYNNHGEVVARYDKIHLFDVTLSETEFYRESDTVEPGNEIVVAETPFGKLGLAVCYDMRFPELFRSMFNMGAELFALPSAFTVKTGEAHWELLARSRAVENFCYLIGACEGGTHSSGRQTYGHSIIIEPWGTVAATIVGVDTGIITAELNLKKLHEIRNAIPIREHQRIFFDKTQLGK